MKGLAAGTLSGAVKPFALEMVEAVALSVLFLHFDVGSVMHTATMYNMSKEQ